MKRLAIILGIVGFACSLSANDSRPVTSADAGYSSETLELLMSRFSLTGDTDLPAEKISYIFDGQRANQPVFVPDAAHSADLPVMAVSVNTNDNEVTNSVRFSNVGLIKPTPANQAFSYAAVQQDDVKNFQALKSVEEDIIDEVKKQSDALEEWDIEAINREFSLIKQTRTGKELCREVFGRFDSCNYDSFKKIKTQIRFTRKKIWEEKRIAALIDNSDPKMRTIYIDASFRYKSALPIVLAHETRHAGDFRKYKIGSKGHKAILLAMEQRAYLTEVHLYKELSEKGKLPTPMAQGEYLQQSRFFADIWDYKNGIGPKPTIGDDWLHPYYPQLDDVKLSRILDYISNPRHNVNNGGVAVTEAVRLEIYPQYDVPAYSDDKLLASRMFSDAIKRDVKFRKWWKKSHPPPTPPGNPAPNPQQPQQPHPGNGHEGGGGWQPPFNPNPHFPDGI